MNDEAVYRTAPATPGPLIIYTDCEGPSNWGIGGVKSNPLQLTGFLDISPGQNVSKVTRGNFPLISTELYIAVHLRFTAKNLAYGQHSALWYVRRANTIPTG